MYTMRLFVALLLIALMPLRVLAGDAMAIHTVLEGARDTVPTSALVAHAECPGEHTAHPTTPSSDDNRHHGSGCNTCALCFTAALELPPLAVARVDLPNTTPRTSSAAYRSAALALYQKPPIS